MSGPLPARPLAEWVDECTRLTRPDRVVWCDGSDEEYHRLIGEMLRAGTLHPLHPEEYPGCALHRSHPSDVARSEQRTFICTEKQEDAGPTNNWMSTGEARKTVGPLFNGCMRGRTLYVVPYLMGPPGSPYTRAGVLVTDSPYVVVNTRTMTRMGRPALERLQGSEDYCRGLHSLGDLSLERRFICHFPDESLIWSIGSGYGGNALLSKKCFALRIASRMGYREGWLAEHMLILGLEDPHGEIIYVAAAFPSACGKTNLAMLVPPATQAGWKVWTVGDDIAWMHFGRDGRLYAVNPEAGFFAVAPGTSTLTNPNMMATIRRNTIFTNVAMTPELRPWWEGMDGPPPAEAVDWQGKPWKPGGSRAAHPNSRFTTPAKQCPSISPRFDDPQGVPISAILFGVRRSHLIPLVYETFDWRHGVFTGATMASESTAAAAGEVGVTRRDPMAMMPFCGYNMADYFRHWLSVGRRSDIAPPIFHVNWFRTDSNGTFLWPGFGENVRILKWIRARCRGEADAVRTPIGYLPTPDSLDLTRLDFPIRKLDLLLAVDRDAWRRELEDQGRFFQTFGDRLPAELWDEHQSLSLRLNRMSA